MKTNALKIGTFLLVLASFFSCERQYPEYFEKEEEEKEEEIEMGIPFIFGLEKGDNFFYYFDEKIFFQQNKERLLLKSVPNIHWSQIRPLLESPDFFVSVAFWSERTPYFLLIANNEKPIPLTTVEFFRAMPQIVSVSYMYRFINGDYFVIDGAHTDMFSVELKKTATFEQLQALANQHNCIVIGEDRFIANRYNLSVSQTSELNAIQISRLFYETGLFEFSSPYFRIFSGLTLSPQIRTPFFYYFFGVRMYLQQVTDKILLKFTQDAGRERIINILNSDSSLQPMSGMNFEDLPENHNLRIAVLETRNGSPIPSAVIEAFKAKTEVVSVSHLYRSSVINQGERGLISFTDEVIVRLRGTTTFQQLKDLAEQHNFTIGAESQFTRNQFMIYVCKTSKLNALQTANLLYETGLFRFAEPNFYMFGSFQLNKNASQ